MKLPLAFLAIAVITLWASSALADDLTAAERGINSSVVIRTATSTGAGVAIDGNLLLTAAHVVGSARTVSIELEGMRSNARVLKVDRNLDLALIDGSGFDATPLPITDTEPRLGRNVYAIGAAEGILSISTGIVSSVRDVNGVRYIQTDAAVNPGNSGGPLIDDSATIVGIVVLKNNAVEGIGYAVSPGEINSFLLNTSSSDEPSKTLDEVAPSQSGNSHLPTIALGGAIAIGTAATSIAVTKRRRNRPPTIVLGRVLTPEIGDHNGNH